MFDIEKARVRGIDERSIKIMQDINENNQKEESCQWHEFEHEKINGLPKYRCKNCGCVEDVSFVKGYMRGLEHVKINGQCGKQDIFRNHSGWDVGVKVPDERCLIEVEV